MRQSRFQFSSRRPAAAVGRRGGFTLIELLVVVALIAALIAILIPTMGRLKNKSRATQTQNLMTQLMHSIESYFTRFDAYPGPIPAAPTAASAYGTAVTGANKVMSGSQNMLMGLSYAMTASNGLPNVRIGTSVFYVNPANPTGPVNFAVTLPTGLNEQLPAFFTPASGQLSPGSSATSWPAGGLANSNTNSTFPFPVVLDTFPDGLPILYYRRSPGVDFPASNDPSTTAAYYLNDNSEYTSANNLKSSSGSTFDQTATPFDVPALTGTVQVPGSSPASAHGGYLLLSAGIDRLYGGAPEVVKNRAIIGGN